MTKRCVGVCVLVLLVGLLPVYAQGGGGAGEPITPHNADRVWQMSVWQHPGGPLADLAFSPDGAHILTAADDGSVQMWHLPDGTPTLLGTHSGAAYSVAISPDGTLVASGGGRDDGTVRLWTLGEAPALLAELQVGAAVTSLAFSPDGARLAAGDGGGMLHVWTLGDPPALWTEQTTPHGTVRSVAFSPDGARLMTAGSDGTMMLWAADGAALESVLTLAGHEGAVWSAAFSPDGARLVSGGNDATVRLWDAASGDALAVLKGHAGVVTRVAFNPDGTLILSADWNGTLRVWNVVSGETAALLTGHAEQIYGAAFSPDGTLIASVGWDGTLRVWGASDLANDDLALAVVRENVDALNAEDLPRYMATLDPGAPLYLATHDSMQVMFETYDLEVTIDAITLLDRTRDEAFVEVIQTMSNRNDEPFDTRQQRVEHRLVISNGQWKIYETVILNEFYLG